MSATNSSAGQPPAPLSPVSALQRGFELEAGVAIAPITAQPLTGAAVLGAQTRQGFIVGSLHLMVPYAVGSELTEMPRFYRLPNAPYWLLGMANLHGALVPVFDLGKYWIGVEHSSLQKPMLLVLGHGVEAAGVVIDGLPQRLRFGSDEVADSTIVPDFLTSCVSRTVLIGGQIWFDLDSNVLLSEFERGLGATQ